MMQAILGLSLGLILILQEWNLIHRFQLVPVGELALLLVLSPVLGWAGARRLRSPSKLVPRLFWTFSVLSTLLCGLAIFHHSYSERLSGDWPQGSEARLLRAAERIRHEFHAFLADLREPLQHWPGGPCLADREACFQQLRELVRRRPKEGDRYGLTLWENGTAAAWAGRTTSRDETGDDFPDGFWIRERGAALVLVFSSRPSADRILVGEYLLQSPLEKGLHLRLQALEEARREERVSITPLSTPGGGGADSLPFRVGTEDLYWGQPRERRTNLFFPLRDPGGKPLAVVNLRDASLDAVLRSFSTRAGLAGLVLSMVAIYLAAHLLFRSNRAPATGADLVRFVLASALLWSARILLLPLASFLPGVALFARDRFACALAGGLFQSPADLFLTSAFLGLQAWWCTRWLTDPSIPPGLRRRVAVGLLLPLAAVGWFLLRLAFEIPIHARFDLLRLDLTPSDPAPLLVQSGLFVAFASWLGMARGIVRAALSSAAPPDSTRPSRIPGAARLYGFACGAVLLYLPVLVLASDHQRERFFSHELLPQVESQRSERREILRDVLHRIRSSPEIQRRIREWREGPDEGMAYQVWAATELREAGLSSSLRILTPDGHLISRFGLNLAPSLEAKTFSPAGGDGIREIQSRLGSIHPRVLVGELVLSPHPGDVLGVQVHLLDDFENLPFIRADNIYVQLFRGSRTEHSNPELLGSEPVVALYAPDGAPVYSSLEAGPELPRSLAASLVIGETRWGTLSVREDRYRALFKRNADGIVAVGFLLPSLLERLGGFLRWSLLGFFPLLVFTAPRVLLAPFRRRTSGPGRFFRRLLASFLLASLIPVLGLTFSLHRFVAREIQEDIASEGLASLGAARRIIEDYRAEGGGEALVGDDIAFWLSKVVRQDISLYSEEKLFATSTREVYASGLLSTRLADSVYRDLVLRRRPYSLNEERLGPLEYLTIAAPITLGEGATGILSLPLAGKKREILRKRADMEEAILIVTVAMFFLLTVLAHHLARRISEPIAALAEASRRIEAGNYDAEVRLVARDEAAQLIESFNRMAASLRKQREDLRRRRDYIEKILLNATTGVISTDPTGRIVTLNPAARLLLGLSTPNLEGRDLLPLLEESPGLTPLRTALARSRPDREGSWQVNLSSDGRPVSLRLVSLPFREETGSEAGRILLLEDLTETVRSSRLEAWAEMARRIAHEIKNPLTPIQLSADHLRKVRASGDPRFDVILEQCLDTIQNQVRALRTIAADFSDYARIPQLRPETVGPEDLLREVLTPYQTAPPRGVVLELRVAADTPPLFVDRAVTQRALLNLIENSLDAMRDGGSLVLTAEPAPGPPAQKRRVRIRIKDTGPGMDPDTLARIFEPYFSTKTSGTGLGLSIVRKSAEEQGGSVQILSSPGVGTEVILDLPAAAEARPPN